MRIFLTGGTGFIGTHFIAAALSSGNQVKALRRSINSVTAIPLFSQPDWLDGRLEDLKPDDITDCDAVVHLASSGVNPRQVPWNELVNVNVTCTAHLVGIAQAAGLERLIVAGTSHEYGASASRYNPIPTTAPLEPLNLYGASKAAAYHVATGFARAHMLNLYYGRIFSVFGEGQYHRNFWPSLRSAALGGHDFPMSSGGQIRDFIPVHDVALKLLYACRRSDIAKGQPLVENVASGKPQTLFQFALSEWMRLGARGRLLPGELGDRIDEAKSIVAEMPTQQETHGSSN